MPELEIRNLHVRAGATAGGNSAGSSTGSQSAGGQEILRGLDLTVGKGEIHALMGPNGSGKSTLANAIMGHPNLEVTDGQIIWDGEDITDAEPDERARMGLFMAFQYPVSVPGVTVTKYLRTVLNAHREAHGEEPISLKEFREKVEAAMKLTNVPREFSSRYLNEGFSGGEKKRNEIFQMAVLDPRLAILDETDSGLDIDALRIVANGVNTLRSPDRSMIVITHYQRLLNYIIPDRVHVMAGGRIVLSGGKELALELEQRGYAWLEKEFAGAVPAGAAR
jgi:Fe-S cluster assembly ATP-binding protein